MAGFVIREFDTIDALARDLRSIAVRADKDLSKVVRRNVKEGTAQAKTLARAGAGKHGKAYYKRISGEMTGPLSGEFGPTGSPKTEFVGVGFRHGHNMDLPRTADIIGPQMAGDVDDAVDKWFW
ncbi:hypothetical protein [Jatrophihabitans sp.]|uniref:hypothetical protein n=1 Tax=Jatrophihabitans sp. TaxID=1932789 RepID=UPI0030C6F955|nr:hypothetical protein [Jatrophihabitans sp.]